ncbi:MAG: GH39 family glycosyl hydrolase [Eubacteriales bacterium]|jgi:xylan 1,4-beta-xylosidase
MVRNDNIGSDIISLSLLTNNSYQLPKITNDFEILYTMSGSVRVSVSGTQKTISKNGVFSINPGVPRSYDVDGAFSALFIISKHKLNKIAPGNTLSFYCDSQSETGKSYRNLRYLFNKALSFWFQEGILNKIKEIECHYEILLELIQNHSNLDAVSDSKGESLGEQRLLAIIEYINYNYYKQIKLADVAERLNLSPSYLSKFIKNESGTGFLQLLNKTRLQHAIDDLIKTDMTVSQVALENGFPNFSSFNRVFREEYDMTPTEYRKANRIETSDINKLPSKNSLERLSQLLSNSQKQSVSKSTLVHSVNITSAKPYKKYWNDIYNLGPANNLLNSDVQNHVLQIHQSYKFKYLFFSGVFSKDLLIDPRSTHGFNYSKLNRIFDFLVNNGIAPFVDIGFQPWGIIGAYGDEIVYEDFDLENFTTREYQTLVSDFMKHLINRYGEEEVSGWCFNVFHNYSHQVYNPKSPQDSFYGFFSTAYNIIKRLVPRARVGGCSPYTYNTDVFSRFVETCSKQGLAPDFFSVQVYPYNLTIYHPEPQNPDIPSNEVQHYDFSKDSKYLPKKINELQNILEIHGYPPDKLFVVGWTMSLSCRNYLNDSTFRGAYIIKNLLSSFGQVTTLAHNGVSDLLYEHFFPTLQLFGGYGLLSKDGLKKPAYYAFDFMNRLGNHLVDVGEHYIITSDGRDGVYIVCHNCGTLTPEYYNDFHDDADYTSVSSLTTSEALSLTLRIGGVSSQRYLMKKFFVNNKSGSVLDEWLRLKYIESIDRNDIEYLKSITVPRQQSEALTNYDGTITIQTELQPNEFQLIQIHPFLQ